MSNEHIVVGPEALQLRREKTAAAQRQVAGTRGQWLARRSYYYDLMRRALAFFVEPGERVLNVRSQTGWMLEAVKPSEGVGLEITREMAEVAHAEHPQFRYEVGFPDVRQVDGTFDSILVADPGETAD